MFPLLRAPLSLSHGLRHDQATDGWMRMMAQPRDTAPVFFHRSACWSSPSSRPEHDLENLQAFDETMRSSKYLERNRDSVRTDFAPGRPPPVHPRRTGACAAMRGFQICVSDQVKCKGRPRGGPYPVPASRCQTARRVACPRSRSRSRGALVRPGCCIRLASASPPLRRLHPFCAAVADASAGEPAVTWATASPPAPK